MFFSGWGRAVEELDPWVKELMEKIALKRGFETSEVYGEKQAANFLRMDQSTLKRQRREGNIRIGMNYGDRMWRYSGYWIAKFLVLGPEDGQPKRPAPKTPQGDGANQTNGEAPWQTEHSKSAKAG